MYDAVSAEELKKPVVVLVNQSFLTDARSAASSKGWPGIRIVPETVPPECTIAERREAGISAAMNDIIAALTRPLTGEEQSPVPAKVEKLPRIVFQGSLEEVNRFYYRRGWTDGLPIIPPTEEAVREMLTGTDLPADHVVAKIIPRMGKATVEKIAVNAVMAGALPTYLPVLIAGVQAVMDPKANFGTTEVSTASWVPFWIINGPIRKDLHVNMTDGVLSPGDIANAAIGRAMGLIIKNIGGARKAIEDMGIFGNPGKYTMVAAENEEASLWEPLHVEHGFQREDSTVTVSFPTAFTLAGAFTSDANGLMRGITSAITNCAGGGITIMVQPQHARTLAEGGWTKQEIKDYVYNYARIPAYRSSGYWRNWVPGRERPALNPEDPMPTVRSSDSVRIIVTGGSGLLFMVLLPSGNRWVTKKVALPANWSSLVDKYKDIVPAHVRY